MGAHPLFLWVFMTWESVDNSDIFIWSLFVCLCWSVSVELASADRRERGGGRGRGIGVDWQKNGATKKNQWPIIIVNHLWSMRLILDNWLQNTMDCNWRFPVKSRREWLDLTLHVANRWVVCVNKDDPLWRRTTVKTHWPTNKRRASKSNDTCSWSTSVSWRE